MSEPKQTPDVWTAARAFADRILDFLRREDPAAEEAYRRREAEREAEVARKLQARRDRTRKA
jgi:hypothetical protein